MYPLPNFVWVPIYIAAIGIPAVTCVMLYRSAMTAGVSRRTGVGVSLIAGAVWGGWILAAALLAGAGVFRQDPSSFRPWLPIALAGAVAAPLLATRIPVVSRILADPGTPARLVLPQTMRVIGSVFLVVSALGALPAVFALPAGLGDFAVGISAPWVAWRAAHGHRAGAMWFNIMGLADLVVAVGLGFLGGIGPYRLLAVTPSTAPLTLLPLAMVPLTAVPLAAALHVISLAKLRAASRPNLHSARAVLAAR